MKLTSVLKPPCKFKPEGWIEFEVKLTNYLFSLCGSSRVPLSYIIRDDNDPDRDLTQLMWQAPLNGKHFDSDKATVFGIINNSIYWIRRVRLDEGYYSLLRRLTYYDSTSCTLRWRQSARSSPTSSKDSH